MNNLVRNIAPTDAAALAHILVSANENAFRGRVPDRCLEFTEAESAANWGRFFDQGIPEDDCMIGAEAEDGQLIAYAWAGPFDDATYRAELRQIMVLPGFQQQGIGTRLLCRVVQRLLEKGIGSLRVNVLEVNPGRAFYERMGGEIVTASLYDWEGVQLPELTYGWKDSRTLLLRRCN